MNKKITTKKLTTLLNGTEFRRRRQEIKKTLHDIASHCGISVSYLCDIELGRRIAKDEVAKKLIAALDMK